MTDFQVEPAELHRCGTSFKAYRPARFGPELPGNFVIEDVLDSVVCLATRSTEFLDDGGKVVNALGQGLHAAAIEYKIADGWPE